MLHSVEVLSGIGQIVIAGAQLVHHQRDRRAGGLAIELTDRLPVLALPLRNFLHHLFELALDFFEVVLDPSALHLG